MTFLASAVVRASKDRFATTSVKSLVTSSGLSFCLATWRANICCWAFVGLALWAGGVVPGVDAFGAGDTGAAGWGDIDSAVLSWASVLGAAGKGSPCEGGGSSCWPSKWIGISWPAFRASARARSGGGAYWELWSYPRVAITS